MRIRPCLLALVSVAVVAVAAAQAPTSVNLLKAARYFQSDATNVSLTAAAFEAEAFFTTVDNGRTGTLTRPGGSLLSFSPGSELVIEQSFPTTAALDTAFPSGLYTVSLGGSAQGLFLIDFPPATYFPPTRVVNYFGLAASPPTGLTFQWLPFTGATTGDYLRVAVQTSTGSDLWESPEPGQPGALNGLDTFVSVPVTLPTGVALTGVIEIYRFVQTSSGATDLIAASGTFVRFNFVLGGPADTTPPTLVSAVPVSGATGVAGNAPLVLTFSEAMDTNRTNLSLSGPASVSTWETQWDPTARVATITLPITLPAGTYTLLLNSDPSGTFAFRDVTGNPLALNTIASVFTVGASSPTSTTRLKNLATRGLVGTGDNVLIGGLVHEGDSPATYLIRGVGPTLGSFGVPGVLADPVLQVLSGSAVVAENDDWSTAPASAEIAAAAQRVGAFPLSSAADAAVLVTLTPGAYTVVVRGQGDATGIALVEVYEIR